VFERDSCLDDEDLVLDIVGKSVRLKDGRKEFFAVHYIFRVE
jgi:hypothetical protein